MAFFGVTYMGNYTALHDSQPVNRSVSFNEIEDSRFEELFDACLLGECTLASELSVPGDSHILRKDLLKILHQLLERDPTKEEFDIFFRCVMSRDEYQVAYRALKQFCQNPGEQREWYSYQTKRTDHIRHKRLGYSPQETLSSSLTESQMVGCGAISVYT